MIAKNEAHVIGRCLRSVRPIISSYVIALDEGTTDDTEAVARRVLEGIPGEVIYSKWVDFATNRNEALELARNKAEYTLTIDADDELEFVPGLEFPELYHDFYMLLVCEPQTSYLRAHLFSNDLPFRFQGAAHETIDYPPHTTGFVLQGVVYRRHINEGASWAQSAQKYERAVAVFETALRDDPTDARSAYYLGQSHLHAGAPSRAVDAYERSVGMSLQPHLKAIALLTIAQLRARMGGATADVIGAFLRAHAYNPRNPEALHCLSAYLSARGEHGLAHAFAAAAMALPRPRAGMGWIDETVHRYGILNQYAEECWHVGLVDEARRASRRLLEEPSSPPDVRARAALRLDLPAEDSCWERPLKLDAALQASLFCASPHGMTGLRRRAY
jgi:tetratricopeptide (TPR) repeat protein